MILKWTVWNIFAKNTRLKRYLIYLFNGFGILLSCQDSNTYEVGQDFLESNTNVLINKFQRTVS